MTDVASQATPVRVGEYRSSCCINSVARKMKEKNEPNSRNAAMSAAIMVLFRSMAPGSRGALDRDSTRTNVASSRIAAANSPSVLADVQPWSTPRLSPYTSSSRPPVTAVAPSASNRREATSGRSAGRNRAARAMRTIPMGTLMKNTQRQPGLSVSRPLAITPIDAEVPATAPSGRSPRRPRGRGVGPNHTRRLRP